MLLLEIENKQHFYRLSHQGLLGNHLEQLDWAQFQARFHELPETIGIRHLARDHPNTGLYPKNIALNYGKNTGGEGMLFDTCVPNDHITLQGELTVTAHYGLYVRCSRLQLHQRRLWELDSVSIKPVVQHVTGVLASQMLQYFMDDNSWQETCRILAEYRNPIIEFACFSVGVGVFGWNTIIWEVRTKT